MNDPQPQRVHRKDYRAPEYTADTIDLRFELGEEDTFVEARTVFRRASGTPAGTPLVLHGAKTLRLLSIELDGERLATNAYKATAETLRIEEVPERFELATRVAIRPQDNTALSGLYKSSGNFCTQCEAEGFRRITYSLDRPDVMARYTTTIVADKERYPVLLSNGNRVETGDLEGGKHFVRWEDPFKKPSYLFALVAGKLACLPGSFTTRSGRDVRLEIWVEPQNADKCEHALASLQKAMKWDEERFGLEYDLDLYMIVAVNDFNMGAMENKGLNIFNSKFVLAKPETATDDDYEAIEGVIAHEYFHNWTGNRVTCRDWFQLTLKEGLTVFRDQSFSADTTSDAVQRIGDVRTLRVAQFAEAAGPMAHPIRPESYVEMNNFYTVTVYNKGAEVVRMYETLLGRDGFRRGMDLYFQRHDGCAVECDDFRAAMADANGVDLTQFERWYDQAGTPTVTARGAYDAGAGTYTLDLSQSSKAMGEEPEPRPFHVPVMTGLVGEDGADLAVSHDGGAPGTTHLLELKQPEQTFVFTGVAMKPVPSLFRGFSAPVKIDVERGRDELAFLMANDGDPFNRWDAGQELAQKLLLELAASWDGSEKALDLQFVDAFRSVLLDAELDGSLKAMALTLPGERQLGLALATVPVDELHAARQFVVKALARALRPELEAAFAANRSDEPYRYDGASVDRRRMKNRALAYLAALEEPATTELASNEYSRADNMTERQAALSILVELGGPACDEAVAAFHAEAKGDPLVLDKWFAVQALSSRPDTLARVQALAEHADFGLENPNRVRSLIGTFTQGNQVRFHAADGAGYRLLSDIVLRVDPKNPQLASRLVSAFNDWKRFDATRQAQMKTELEQIAGAPKLSKDVGEIVGRALNATDG